MCRLAPGAARSAAWGMSARNTLQLPNPTAGFTLLELLVVMVIIGLLAGFVAPRYFAQVGKSQVKVARAQIDALDKALDELRLDLGRYPTSEEGLAILVVPPGRPSLPNDSRSKSPWAPGCWYR